jgi:hypothetical protein
MKSTLAQHQPPPELVRAVRLISQPRWKRILRITDRRLGPAIDQPAQLSVWRKNITVPLPALALLLIAAALGAWSFARRIEQTPANAPNDQSLQAIKIAGPPATGEALTFSRFDHGQQAIIYKTRR